MSVSAPPLEKVALGSPSISELFNGLEEGDRTPLPPADGERPAEPARYAETSGGRSFRRCHSRARMMLGC